MSVDELTEEEIEKALKNAVKKKSKKPSKKEGDSSISTEDKRSKRISKKNRKDPITRISIDPLLGGLVERANIRRRKQL
jgi:Mg-chelatase subunit ChlD